MKYTRTITTEIERPYTVCDKCQKEVVIQGSETFDFEFECRKGTIYSDHSFGTTYRMDLCQSCSNECIELLQENGFLLQPVEYDF